MAEAHDRSGMVTAYDSPESSLAAQLASARAEAKRYADMMRVLTVRNAALLTEVAELRAAGDTLCAKYEAASAQRAQAWARDTVTPAQLARPVGAPGRASAHAGQLFSPSLNLRDGLGASVTDEDDQLFSPSLNLRDGLGASVTDEDDEHLLCDNTGEHDEPAGRYAGGVVRRVVLRERGRRRWTLTEQRALMRGAHALGFKDLVEYKWAALVQQNKVFGIPEYRDSRMLKDAFATIRKVYYGNNVNAVWSDASLICMVPK